MTTSRIRRLTQVDTGLYELINDVQLDRERGAIRFGDDALEVTPGSEIDGVLSAYIYGKFHSRSGESITENKWTRTDPEVEAQIVRVTPKTMNYLRVPLLEMVSEPDGVFAHYFGLRTFFPEDRCVLIGSDSVLVKIQTVLPSMSMGFFHYTGQAGPGNSTNLLRIYYASDTPQAAVQAWMKLISFADDAMLPFRAKILSRSFEYPRSDAIVVYLPSESWDHTDELCRLLGSESSSDLSSIFTLPVHDGVAVSWEPYVQSVTAQRKSFGEHRSSSVAKGYVDALRQGVDLRPAIRSNLISANIDPLQVYRNLDSPSVLLRASKFVCEHG